MAMHVITPRLTAEEKGYCDAQRRMRTLAMLRTAGAEVVTVDQIEAIAAEFTACNTAAEVDAVYKAAIKDGFDMELAKAFRKMAKGSIRAAAAA